MRRRKFITLLGGAAVAWPRSGPAQVSTRRPLVALLHGQSSAAASHIVAGFAQGMQEHGYVAGRDCDVVYR
jgi:putative ABC transport system substrate-binding protein